MVLEPITCNNCGVVLDVPPGANYVTCAHCGSPLAVKRTSSVIYTEVLQQPDAHTLDGGYTEVLQHLDARTQQMSSDVTQLQLERELDRLDHEWEKVCKQYLLSSSNNPSNAPMRQVLTPVVFAVGAVVVFLFFLLESAVLGLATGSVSILFYLAAAVFGGIALWAVINAARKADEFHQAETKYLARRAAIQQRFGKQ